MKTLLITHTDLDGISPIILLNLTGIDFEYKTIEISDIENTFNELFQTDLTQYENIYITDLTLPEIIYEKINQLGLSNIKVFDHHASHLFANQNPYCTIEVEHDGKKTCGTDIFYRYLKSIYKELDKPIIADYIKQVCELDTYTFTSELPHQIDAIRSLLGRIDFIKSITKRLKKNKNNFELTAFEKRYVKLKSDEIKRYIHVKEEAMYTYLIDNYKCGIVFAENHKSDLGNVVSENHPELDLVIIIDPSKGVSYRTAKDDVPVHTFAEKYHGGGHQKASGSRFSDEDKIKIIMGYFDNPKEIKVNENVQEQ